MYHPAFGAEVEKRVNKEMKSVTRFSHKNRSLLLGSSVFSGSANNNIQF